MADATQEMQILSIQYKKKSKKESSMADFIFFQHFSNIEPRFTDTRLFRTVLFAPTKSSYIFS